MATSDYPPCNETARGDEYVTTTTRCLRRPLPIGAGVLFHWLREQAVLIPGPRAPTRKSSPLDLPTPRRSTSMSSSPPSRRCGCGDSRSHPWNATGRAHPTPMRTARAGWPAPTCSTARSSRSSTVRPSRRGGSSASTRGASPGCRTASPSPEYTPRVFLPFHRFLDEHHRGAFDELYRVEGGVARPRLDPEALELISVYLDACRDRIDELAD
jgi:hypothetical protein